MKVQSDVFLMNVVPKGFRSTITFFNRETVDLVGCPESLGLFSKTSKTSSWYIFYCAQVSKYLFHRLKSSLFCWLKTRKHSVSRLIPYMCPMCTKAEVQPFYVPMLQNTVHFYSEEVINQAHTHHSPASSRTICQLGIWGNNKWRLGWAWPLMMQMQMPSLSVDTPARGLYSRRQPKSTNLVIVIWGPCTTLNSTFYCRNVKIRTQCFNFHKPIFQNWWNEKFYPKNIGWPWNVPLNSWKIVQSTPVSILHLILEFGTNLMSRSGRKKWFYTT